MKGRGYRSTGTEKKLVILVLVASKNNTILFDVLEEVHKRYKRRIQVRDSTKNKYVFKLYIYNKYNLAKIYKSCTIICNILRVENQVFLKVY